MNSEHIVRSFSEELNALQSLIQEMARLAEAQLADGFDAMMRGDMAAAAMVVAGDERIDRLHGETLRLAQSMLARRQPMARDLREIVACSRIASDIERIGDHAKSIAKRAIKLEGAPPAPVVPGLQRLMTSVRDAFHDVMRAFAASDADAALRIWREDQASDAIYDHLFEQVIGVMKDDPASLRRCTHLMFVAKGLERIGDHATNIAEDVVYMATGEFMTEGRNSL
ncbi:MAG TPA: phosphate signaling complex protein PhoU [Sphingomonadales bacterium]